MSKVNIALLQHSCQAQTAANFAKVAGLIAVAARQGAQIIATQELFKSRYFCQHEAYDLFKLAEPVNEKAATVKALSGLARKHKVVIVASLFERVAGGVYYNTAVVLDADGKYLGKYRKMHIPDDPQFYEKFYFAPGDLGFKVFKTRYADIGVLICWDQWYPEAARLTALLGAQIIFYPTAIGWLPADKKVYGERQHASWETIQRSHAIANGCFVAAANRVGSEPNPEKGKEGIEFWGQSFVADPYGTVIKRASSNKEEAFIVPVDLAVIETKRVQWPFLRDRRIDSYNGILSRFHEE
ncbi:MAG: carbon-nitrogen hydrolase [Candidatus Omnitrophica bacterium]|nr:carbon-nitrogen hydrolase [Candidatus Omnitrophota bacterium]